jgi:hypothetical protein
MNDRAAILIRALRLEVENRYLKEALRQRRAAPEETTRIIELRERGATWAAIGQQVGMSAEAARLRYRRVKEAA